LDANPEISILVIDEIQRNPDLLHVVHALIEEKKDIQFIMTGSSSRKLKRSGVDLLAGRAVKRTMHPFIASELGELFNLEDALKLGMLPVVWGSKDPEEVLDTYKDLYIQEEVHFESLIRNFGQFTRFLSVIAFSHAGVLNTSNISRECEVKRNTVESYIEILKDLLLAFLVPVFTKRAKRNLTSHPKFYLFDAGIFRAFRATRILDSTQEIDGAGLEGLVFQHLKAWCDYSKGNHEIFY
jgi:predicted AAA+ superfamily ATPase